MVKKMSRKTKAAKNTITITFNNKNYNIEITKLMYAISRLEGKNVKYISELQAKAYMLKYHLYDDIFLDGINKIW